jgi:hypothetical protein
MAAPTHPRSDIDGELEVFARVITDLYELAEEWDGDLSDPWHYSEMLSWRSSLTRLERYLDGPYRSGQMTPEQAESYRALLRKLEEALPVIDRLGFSRPRVSLES